VGRFDELSDLDFEEVVADLMRAAHDLPFRAGTRGRDAGIDVAAREGRRRLHAVQCKHYRDSTYAHLKTAAAAEHRRLAAAGSRFTTYRFVTSLRLNHRQRTEITDSLQPWIGTEEHVLGENDLRRLLREHPAVEGRHVKLWLPGAGAFSHLLNAAAYARSHALLEETRAALPRYVQTESFLSARELLHREGVCVIAGPPGVGKTTLARLLLIDGLESGYQPYEIVPGHFQDAWSLTEVDERQLYYFDDFLGQTSLNESREHDEDLLRFMRRIARDDKRLLVLTTREYILQQARRLSEVLDREHDDSKQFLLKLERYGRIERARIFYNHIYFSDDVDDVARRSLVNERAYLRVVDHVSYSPRLIEWMTGMSAHRLSPFEREHYADYCVSVLERPQALWAHAFERGISDPERALLISMLGLSTRVAYADLERSVLAALAVRGEDAGGRAFQYAVRTLDDSFLTSHRTRDDIAFSVINPSLIDFLSGYLRDSVPDATRAVQSACYLEQVLWLWKELPSLRASDDDTVNLFAAAFTRTLDDAPSRDRTEAIADFARRSLETPADRLMAVMDCVEESRTLAKQLRDPMTRYGEAVIDGIKAGERVDGQTMRLYRRLVAAEFMDRNTSSGILLKAIRSRPPAADRWDLLDDLRRVVPEAIDDALWTEERAGLEAYIEDVLAEPTGYLGDVDALGSLEDVAGYFDLGLDEQALEQAREDLEDHQRDSDWEPDDDDYRGLRERSDEDPDIVAMFDRLVEE
jgi:hypothetical protein